MKIYCENPYGKRFTIQGKEEGERVVVNAGVLKASGGGGRVFRLSKDDLERGLSVCIQDWTFEKYSPIEHDSKLRRR